MYILVANSQSLANSGTIRGPMSLMLLSWPSTTEAHSGIVTLVGASSTTMPPPSGVTFNAEQTSGWIDEAESIAIRA